MVDLTFLLDYIDLMNLGICLCIGFALKYAKFFERFGNQYIPLTMLVLGCVISVLTHTDGFSAEAALGGMLSGLASTGLYEMFRNLISAGKGEEKDEGN